MNPYQRILLTIVGSVCVSFILFWIVQSQEDYVDNVLEVNAGLSGTQLSELNLVDNMVNLPLELQIAKVSWQHSILSVDLLSVPGNTIDDMVYHDLFELSRFGLFQVSNVNQVLVRVIEHKETAVNRNELLVAMDSRKENVQDQRLTKRESNTVNKLKYLQSHFNLTYTQKWKEQFVD